MPSGHSSRAVGTCPQKLPAAGVEAVVELLHQGERLRREDPLGVRTAAYQQFESCITSV